MLDKPAPIIQLDQFLKWHGLVSTGGQAKLVIQAGEVKVNGVVETRRKKKLQAGDTVTFAGRMLVVEVEKFR
jgi:ribosome-associated protein